MKTKEKQQEKITFNLAMATAQNKKVIEEKEVEMLDENGTYQMVTVSFLKLTHKQMIDFEAPGLTTDEKAQIEAAKTKRVRLLQMSLLNDDGSAMFPDKNKIDELRNMPFETVDNLYKAACEVNVNGVERRKNAVEEALKN